MAAHARGTLDERSLRFRHELGIAHSTPIIMSGHQAGFWHAGIVAKYVSVAAAARAATQQFGHAAAVWLVADLDDNDPAKLRVPMRDDSGRLGARDVELFERLDGVIGVATGSRGPLHAARVLPAGTPREIGRVTSVLSERHSSSRTLAEQVHGAAEHLLIDAGLERVPAIHASAIAGTGLFREFCLRMVADPKSCVESYNTAARAYPEAGVRELSVRGGRYELPIWVSQWKQPRSAVYIEAGAKVDAEHWSPRALLMTGLMRLAGCDFFIHGTGGGVYDKVTERWFYLWLGGRGLAPAGVVSATKWLDLGIEAVPEREVARVVAEGHRARHDPALVGDAEAGTQKLEIVRQIEALPRKSVERAEAYFRLHTLLESVRQTRGARIGDIEQRAIDMRASAEAYGLARDRTWSFVLHRLETLHSLRHQIELAFGLDSSHGAHN